MLFLAIALPLAEAHGNGKNTVHSSQYLPQGQGESQVPIEATIVEISAHPDRYNHRLVTFTASYLGTIHGSGLYRCDMGRIIDLQGWAGARGQRDIEDAVNQNFAGSIGKEVSATWTGRITWGEDPDWRRSVAIQVIDVRNIVASSRGLRPSCRGGLAALFAPQLSELGF